MNKNDCENIGLYLAQSKTKGELEAQLLTLDPRIRSELDSFREVLGDDEETEVRYAQLMVDEYGKDWVFLKRVKTENRQKEIWQKAYNEVRGIK